MNSNLIIQYILVTIVIISAIIWILYRLLSRKGKNKCCGCAFKDSCNMQNKTNNDCCKTNTDNKKS